MTEQPPTRFENYPPDAPATPYPGADPAPLPPPAVYVRSAPVSPPPRTHSRRGLIVGLLALTIGGPAVVTVALNASNPSPSETYEDGSPGYEDEVNEEETEAPTDFTVGDYTADVPSGWTLTSSDDAKAVLTRDANQVTVMVFDPASEDPRPVDDIAKAVRTAATGFSGSVGKPVNESTGSRALATMSGKGRFNGEAARQFAELWLDDSVYLLIVTVLTAAEGSAVARQAIGIGSALTSGLR